MTKLIISTILLLALLACLNIVDAQWGTGDSGWWMGRRRHWWDHDAWLYRPGGSWGGQRGRWGMAGGGQGFGRSGGWDNDGFGMGNNFGNRGNDFGNSRGGDFGDRGSNFGNRGNNFGGSNGGFGSYGGNSNSQGSDFNSQESSGGFHRGDSNFNGRRDSSKRGNFDSDDTQQSGVQLPLAPSPNFDAGFSDDRDLSKMRLRGPPGRA